jgi:hypothetical protein
MTYLPFEARVFHSVPLNHLSEGRVGLEVHACPLVGPQQTDPEALVHLHPACPVWEVW